MISANLTKAQRKTIYRRDGFRCALCDSTKYLQLHHVIPRGEGGPDTAQNLITLCSDCHAMAHGINLRGWIDMDQETICQNIVEYLADMYAREGIIWNPWNKPGPP